MSSCFTQTPLAQAEGQLAVAHSTAQWLSAQQMVMGADCKLLISLCFGPEMTA